MEIAAQGRAAGVRFGVKSVLVKDRVEQKSQEKRKNECSGESKKSAASESALRRIQSSKQVTQKKPSMGLASTHRQYLDIMKNDDI